MSLSAKPSLRRHLRQCRRGLPVAYRQTAAQQVCLRVLRTRQFRVARHIAFYWPSDAEMSVLPLLRQSLRLGKNCYLPVVRDNRLIFRHYLPKTLLRRNRYGIPEPAPRHAAKPTHELDIVLLPLVGFDASCNRLGMGAGFYDRVFSTLRHRRPLLWGVAYELQKVEHLPVDPWDVPLDAVITERAIYRRTIR